MVDRKGYFIENGEGILLSPCNNCIHRISPTKCKAFERIPDQILKGHNNHHKPFKGDHGIQFAFKGSEK